MLPLVTPEVSGGGVGAVAAGAGAGAGAFSAGGGVDCEQAAMKPAQASQTRVRFMERSPGKNAIDQSILRIDTAHRPKVIAASRAALAFVLRAPVCRGEGVPKLQLGLLTGNPAVWMRQSLPT